MPREYYAKRLRETREEREDEMQQLLQKKFDKKAFAGEALSRDGAPISYKKLSKCPDSILKFFTGFATAKQYRIYYEMDS